MADEHQPEVSWPDMSGGIIEDMLNHPSKWMEWPISGDALKTRESDSLLHLVDWESMADGT